MAGEATTYRGDRTGVVLERLTPHPHRGDVIAAGVVVLTTFALVLDLRFTPEWHSGVRLVLVALMALLVGAMAVLSPLEDEEPRAYQAVLYVATFVLALLVLKDLADALGAEGVPAGTLVWAGSLLMALALWFAMNRNAAIMTLLAAGTGVLVVLAFVQWVFEPDGASAFRWILLLCAVGLVLATIYLRDLRRRHAVALADVVGLTIVLLALTILVEGIFSAFSFNLGGGPQVELQGGSAGWELVLLAFGLGLIAYGCVDRERVPAFLGVVVLGLFVAIAWPAGADGASLLGWPIVLLVLAGVLLAIGLRPRADLPPEPTPPAPPPLVTPVTAATMTPVPPEDTTVTERHDPT